MAVLVLLPVVPAQAHRFTPQRELVLQVDDQGGVTLWRMWIRGQQAGVLRLAHDRDHDGSFSDAEAPALALAIMARAVAGVEITWDGRVVKPTDLRAELEPQPPQSSALAAAGLARLPLPEAERPKHHVIGVRLQQRAGPLAVMVQTLGQWRVVSSNAAPVAGDGRGLAGAVELEAGHGFEVRVRRVIPDGADAGN